MGKSITMPAAPDYSAISQASENVAKIGAQTAADQLQWAKDQYQSSSDTQKGYWNDYMKYLDTQTTNNQNATDFAQDITKQTVDQNQKVIDQALGIQQTNADNAQKDREFYQQNYQPLETQAITDEQQYGSEANENRMRGQAEAGVAQSFDSARAGALASLESFGVDPSSTRYAALDIGLRASKAAAQAASGNQSDLNLEATQRAMRSDLINVGRGYPGQIAGTYGTALQAGNAAANTGFGNAAAGNSAAGTQFGNAASGGGLYNGGTNMFNAGTNAAGTYGGLMGSGPAWASIGNQGLSTMLGSANGLGQYGLGVANYNQNSSSGIGSALGLLGAIPGLARGGTVPATPASGGAPTGAVPVDASPSRGQAIDDVPARLQPGEFVTPRDVVAWKGEEFFQKLINQSRQARQKSQAIPTMRPPLPGQAKFMSPTLQANTTPRTQAGPSALPV